MLRQPGPGPREMQRDLTQEANAGYGGDVPEQKPTTDMAPDKRLRLRSITFKRPPTGLSDSDAAESLPVGLNLALCSRKSGSDEARQGQSRNAVSGDGGVGSPEGNAGKQ
jgi:hypothetical protein